MKLGISSLNYNSSHKNTHKILINICHSTASINQTSPDYGVEQYKMYIMRVNCVTGWYFQDKAMNL
jgi:hypothetical protein